MTLPSPTGQFSTTQAFCHLAPGVGSGSPLPADWLQLAEQPLLVFVGPTGVGKSTTVKQLAKLGLRFTLLPDRRVLTDRLIVAPLAAAAGRTEPVACRLERLEYARRYRQQHPGGMAEILQHLATAPTEVQSLLLFDGLRGEAEISYAARALPQAVFAMLDAPDKVRLLRMLHRADPFDRVQAAAATSSQAAIADLTALGVPEATSYFNKAEVAELLDLVRAGLVTAHELRGKLKVIVEQAQVYQPRATAAALQRLAGDRALILDTATLVPAQVASRIVAKLRSRWPGVAYLGSV